MSNSRETEEQKIARIARITADLDRVQGFIQGTDKTLENISIDLELQRTAWIESQIEMYEQRIERARKVIRDSKNEMNNQFNPEQQSLVTAIETEILNAIKILEKIKNYFQKRIQSAKNREIEIQAPTKEEFENNKKLNKLISAIDKLPGEYVALGRTVHEDEIYQLNIELKAIRDTRDIGAQEKYTKMVAALQNAFNKEKDNYCKPFFSFWGSTKPPQAFIDKINSTQKEYHYPRLLGILLQTASVINPEIEKSELIEGIKLGKDKFGIYESKIKTLLDATELEQFRKFADMKEPGKITQVQTYRLFKGQEKMNYQLALKIWPELKEYGYDKSGL